MYFDAYDQLILLVRQRQHDMKSHIGAIRSMIYTTDNYAELVAKQEEYCDYTVINNLFLFITAFDSLFSLTLEQKSTSNKRQPIFINNSFI